MDSRIGVGLSKTLSGPPDPASIHWEICAPSLGLKITGGSLTRDAEPTLSSLGLLKEISGVVLHEARRFLGERAMGIDVDFSPMELVTFEALKKIFETTSFSMLGASDPANWKLEVIVGSCGQSLARWAAEVL